MRELGLSLFELRDSGLLAIPENTSDVLISSSGGTRLLPNDEAKPLDIKEAYRDYKPPINAGAIVRQLLTRVDPKHLRGLDCVVLSNLSGQPRRKRLGKTTSRGRRISQSRVAGLYHPKWKGQPPWIELYIDQILYSFPRWALWLPILRDFAIAQTFYHELGHHIHYTIRPEHREKEDVADDWGRKFTRQFVRRKYSYMIPIFKVIGFFRRK